MNANPTTPRSHSLHVANATRLARPQAEVGLGADAARFSEVLDADRARRGIQRHVEDSTAAGSEARGAVAAPSTQCVAR